MAEPLSADEENTFEFLFSNLIGQPREPSGIAPMPQPPPGPRVEICDAQGCRNVLGEFRHIVLHGDKRDQTCSIACAIRFSKSLGEKISSHIKVGKFNEKKK